MYNTIQAYNNSYLSNIKNILTGGEWFQGNKATLLGQAVHQMVLQKKLYKTKKTYWQNTLTKSQFKKAQLMAQALEQNTLWRHIRRKKGETEIIKTWTEQETQAPCKGIIDKKISKDIFDIKTTSATNQQEFYQSIKKYEYERQAAMYLDATGAQYFTWICVSNRNLETWTITIPQNHELITKGQKKYKFLINKCIHLGIKPNMKPQTITKIINLKKENT